MRRIGLAVLAVAALTLAAWALGGAPIAAGPSRAPELSRGSVATPTLTGDGTPAVPGGRTSPSVGPSVSGSRELVARRIRIDRLEIDLPVVEGDGIDAPIFKAAHYPGTAWPGGGSNIYLYAHAQKGMFLSLWNVRVGDEVDLDLVDGSTRAYAISKVIPKAPWNDMQLVAPTPTEQLTLQTSTSNYATAPRFVAIALPLAANP